MGLEWYPKTPKEIAEYQRMRREWQKYKQESCDNDSTPSPEHKRTAKPERAPGCLKAVSVFLTIVCSLYGILLFSSSEKFVPVNTSNYIQQAKEVTDNVNRFYAMLMDDFAGTGKTDYARYEPVIESTLTEIEELREMSISSFSVFCEYQDACEAYFGCVYDFLQNIKANRAIDVEEYKAFALGVQRLQNPQDVLEKLFKVHGFYYYKDDEGVLHYKTRGQPSLVF